MVFFFFFKRQDSEKITSSDEIKLLEEEQRRIKIRLTKIEAEILDVATAQDIIRNKVLRKIQVKKDPEEEEKPEGWNGIPLTSE